jgi:hypothetical protein
MACGAKDSFKQPPFPEVGGKQSVEKGDFPSRGAQFGQQNEARQREIPLFQQAARILLEAGTL